MLSCSSGGGRSFGREKRSQSRMRTFLLFVLLFLFFFVCMCVCVGGIVLRNALVITLIFRYGDDKGASEMIFSYGFLEHSVHSARQLFLALDIPDDDPLKQAKKRICAHHTAPGLRLAVEHDGKTNWESDFIYWACVNEEDGLSFELMQLNEGGPPELKVLWKGEEEIAYVSPETSTTNVKSLRDVLSRDPQWEIFHLRAVVLVQQCVQSHIDMLGGDMEQEFKNVEHDRGGSSLGRGEN